MNYKVSIKSIPKCLWLFALTIFPMVVLGQSESQSPKRFSIGLNIEPLYAYRHLNYSGGNQNLSEIRDAEELPKLGFAAGLNFKHLLTEKLAVEYGLSYASSGYKTNYSSLSFISTEPSDPINSKTNFTYHTLGLPVSLSYDLKIGKWNTYLLAGFSINHILDKTTSLSVEYIDGEVIKSSDKSTEGFQPFTFSAFAGFGVKFDIFDNLTFNIEPTFRQGLSAIIADKSALERPYSFGINMKVYYNFKQKN